jgi:hypothetical protein
MVNFDELAGEVDSPVTGLDYQVLNFIKGYS